jgi:dienelactone hydrolase
MKVFAWILLLALLPACQNSGKSEEASEPSHQPALVAKDLFYEHDGRPYKGYLVYDSALAGMRPGVLVVHEWWGHNEHARKAARKLAEAGYTALALDMFGEGVQASHPDQAMALSGAVMEQFEDAKARFAAALEVLLNQAPTRPDDLAAIGYCFGGGIVLNMARQGMPLDAVASFHGSLDPIQPAQAGLTQSRVLVLNGELDPFVSSESKAAFRREMEEAGVDYTFIDYPGAVHAFTNPYADAMGAKFSLPLAYQAEADQQSWQAMLDFLGETFAP